MTIVAIRVLQPLSLAESAGPMHLTEAEPVLTSLPIAIRDQQPTTSRVMAALKH